MMSIKNATQRPWTKNKNYGWLEGENGNRVSAYDLGLSVTMTNPDDESRANTELVVTAVNAYDPLVEALSMCLDLIDEMSPFVKDMSLQDYGAFNEAPLKARDALRLAKAKS